GLQPAGRFLLGLLSAEHLQARHPDPALHIARPDPDHAVHRDPVPHPLGRPRQQRAHHLGHVSREGSAGRRLRDVPERSILTIDDHAWPSARTAEIPGMKKYPPPRTVTRRVELATRKSPAADSIV